MLFRNCAIAKAFGYVHSLFSDKAKRAHVITRSMGGLALQAWADAVNALYELGIFIVTAAGNNFGNLPTRNIVSQHVSSAWWRIVGRWPTGLPRWQPPQRALGEMVR